MRQVNMKVKRTLAVALAAAVCGTGQALACSAILVGKAASATGRVLVGHNEDDRGREMFVRHARVPARDWPEGTTLPAEKGRAAVPQARHTYGFYWSEVKPPSGGLSNADLFLNENGVLVASDTAAPVPFEDKWTALTDGGVYYNLRRAVAERARNARDAVDVATNLVLRYGYAAPGRIYILADRDEAWTLQVLKGRRFVARRCPDDGVVAVPNCLTIRRLEAGDVVSPSVAEAAANDAAFDFARAYQGERRWRHETDTLRWRHLYRLAAGVDVGREFPFSVVPARKVTPADLRAALSTHYEGTPDEMKPKHGKNLEDLHLPVCRSSTIESSICTFGATLAETELAISPGSPCENPYRTFRPFGDGLPAAFDRSADAVQRLERHLLPMTADDYLAEYTWPDTADGIGRFDLSDLPRRVLYDARQPLDRGSDCEVAVVLVHGWGGGLHRAWEMAPMMRALAAATPSGTAAPYVVAPLFPREELVQKGGFEAFSLASWNAERREISQAWRAADDWRGGGDAIGTTLSSYDVIDRIFRALADRTRYPRLRRVVLTGFSAGGQFVGRYAAVGKGVVREGVELAYAAMAPSTELRLDRDEDWLYGLRGRPRYAAALSEDAILANLSSRRVWRGCGTEDVLGWPNTSLDMTPAAVKQGRNRYERFRNFEIYLAAYPAWARQVSFHAFKGIGHDTVAAHSDPAFIAFAVGATR